jgi:plasmid stabilization system protein ParE
VRFAEELEAALGRIVEAPRRWPLHLHGTRRIPVLRFPHLVLYREESTRILVVAVANGRRRPGYWKAR